MKREEIQHLLGGYAAGTLTSEEQKLLFAAAMEDQSLFDALADEQALKELLDDPEARGYLRAALDEEAAPAKRAWWPKAAAFSAIAAVLAVVTVVGIRQTAGNKPNTVAVDASKPTTDVAQNKPVPESPEQQNAAPARRREAAPMAEAAVSTKPKQAKAAAAEPPMPVQAEDKKSEVAVAAAPPPPPAAPVVIAETREKEMAKSAPASEMAAGRVSAANAVQISASQLFLTQYRQNFTPAADAQPAGGGQTFGQLRDSLQRKRAEPQQRQQQAPQDRASNPRPAAASAPGSAGPQVTVNRGIRYQILRRNSQGQFVQTRLDTRFEAGDEIQLLVEKNAPGVVAVLAGAAPVTLAAQTAASAQTAPIRLTAGSLDLSIVFAESNATASSTPAYGQLTEQSGNLVYVVLPGTIPVPVVAKFRITVY